MDLITGKGKKGPIIKTWEQCRALSSALIRRVVLVLVLAVKKTSGSSSRCCWPGLKQLDKYYYYYCGGGGKKRRVAPEGCFSVYVGEEKQRFVIKTEYVNHPLFKLLLEEAESEYGYSSEGPLVLPCDVQVFVKVLVEMNG
ncbi:hypothetical protein LguiA_032894 [Lonicera macranthoides]